MGQMEGLRLLVSANMNTHGAKPGEICRESLVDGSNWLYQW